jgi:hypothetical protein
MSDSQHARLSLPRLLLKWGLITVAFLATLYAIWFCYVLYAIYA